MFAKSGSYSCDTTVVIPWRDTGCVHRKRHLEFLIPYYETFAPVLISDSPHHEFNRSGARNAGVNMATSAVVAVVDADNYIPLDRLAQSVSLAMAEDRVVRPFDEVHYLTDAATNRFYEGPQTFSLRPSDYEERTPQEIKLDKCGGAYVVKRTSWMSVGGMDERFTGWGLEDTEFNQRSSALLGRQLIVPGPNYNLYHPSRRVPNPANTRLLDSINLQTG